MSQIISGNSVAKLCDHIFSQTIVDMSAGCGYRIVKNLSVVEKIKSNQSVFVKTDYLCDFFLAIQARNDLNNIIVVTHDSDRAIDQYIVSSIPPSVKKMLSINSVVADSKVEPIPIGIANDYCKITVKPKEQQRLSSKGVKALIACNVQNNVAERAPLYHHKFDKEVTVVTDSLSLSDYVSVASQHDFIFCPEGNGPDTHRVWETLYMGKIPIVKTATWNRSFRDLPIMFVDSLLDATKEKRQNFISSNIFYAKTDKTALKHWQNVLQEIKNEHNTRKV